MRDSPIGTDAVETIESGLVDLSTFSFNDVVRLGDPTPHDTVLRHALLRILADPEGAVAEFNSACTVHLI
jgi:hypothetical protein